MWRAIRMTEASRRSSGACQDSVTMHLSNLDSKYFTIEITTSELKLRSMKKMLQHPKKRFLSTLSTKRSPTECQCSKNWKSRSKSLWCLKFFRWCRCKFLSRFFTLTPLAKTTISPTTNPSKWRTWNSTNFLWWLTFKGSLLKETKLPRLRAKKLGKSLCFQMGFSTCPSQSSKCALNKVARKAWPRGDTWREAI